MDYTLETDRSRALALIGVIAAVFCMAVLLVSMAGMMLDFDPWTGNSLMILTVNTIAIAAAAMIFTRPYWSA